MQTVSTLFGNSYSLCQTFGFCWPLKTCNNANVASTSGKQPSVTGRRTNIHVYVPAPRWQPPDKYTCILLVLTPATAPLCPQFDQLAAPLRSEPDFWLVDRPANGSAVAATRLMEERLMSRKLDTGQQTGRQGQGLLSSELPRRGPHSTSITLNWKLLSSNVKTWTRLKAKLQSPFDQEVVLN